MKVAFFVFNTGNGDLRVHRQASRLAQAGLDVRIYCFLEPGLPEREKRGGYEILRFDQRNRITRFFDDQVLARHKKKPKKPPEPSAPIQVPVLEDREATLPVPPPFERTLAARSTPDELRYLDYIATINRVWTQNATSWKPDVCQAHDLDALQAAHDTAVQCGSKLVYDSHELWTDQPFVRTQQAVEYWNQLEAKLIAKCDACLSVSRPFAHVIASRYNVQVTPLHNCQEFVQPQPEFHRTLERQFGKPVALYQGVFGHERGLEELVASARYQDRVHIALRGYGAVEPVLREMAKQFDHVTILDPCPSSEIVSRASEGTLGVIPFQPTCLNHYYNTPNKMFEFMMAGLPIASADLPDLRDFVTTIGMGTLFDPRSLSDMARGIVELAFHPELEQMRQRALTAAKERWNWQVEGRVLLEVYSRLLGQSLSTEEVGLGNRP